MIIKLPLRCDEELWETVLDDMGIEDQEERDNITNICYLEEYILEIDSDLGDLVRVNNQDIE